MVAINDTADLKRHIAMLTNKTMCTTAITKFTMFGVQRHADHGHSSIARTAATRLWREVPGAAPELPVLGSEPPPLRHGEPGTGRPQR